MWTGCSAIHSSHSRSCPPTARFAGRHPHPPRLPHSRPRPPPHSPHCSLTAAIHRRTRRHHNSARRLRRLHSRCRHLRMPTAAITGRRRDDRFYRFFDVVPTQHRCSHAIHRPYHHRLQAAVCISPAHHHCRLVVPIRRRRNPPRRPLYCLPTCPSPAHHSLRLSVMVRTMHLCATRLIRRSR